MSATNHGRERIRKRTGIPKASVDKQIERVLANGKPVSELRGAFKKYVDYKCRFYKTRAVLYGNVLYFFGNEDQLVTTHPVPGRFKKYL